MRSRKVVWFAGLSVFALLSVCLAAQAILIEHDPGGSIADTKDKPLTYGLKVASPWKDGGHVILNLPEHFTFASNERGILHWSDNRPPINLENPWKLSADGREATLDVESPHTKGVRVVGKVSAVPTRRDRVALTMKIVNGRDFKLDAIRGLYCVHYRMLAGFPSWEEGLAWCYVLIDGKWAKLSDLPTKNAKTVVKWAKVKGRDVQPKEFVTSRGGVIEKDLDSAVAVVTAKDGKRKLAIGWKPGGTMLANAGIPCIHADPWYEDIPPGESREAEGVMIFTEKSLDEILDEFRKMGFVKEAEGERK